MTTSKDTEGILFECRSIFIDSNTVFQRAVLEFTPLFAEIQSNLREEYRPLKLCPSFVLNWIELKPTLRNIKSK